MINSVDLPYRLWTQLVPGAVEKGAPAFSADN